MNNKITKRLVSTLIALPREEKKEAIALLINDEEFKIHLFALLSQKLSLNQNSLHYKQQETNNELSRREIGRTIRNNYILELKNKGILINLVENIWGKTSSGLFVAIPFANEKRSNRWFLGLGEIDLLNKKKSNRVAIVLLCKTSNGKLLDFVIPSSEVQSLIPYLSISNGQYKFNLKKNRDRYELLLTDEKPFDVSEYNNKISLLK